MSIRHNLRNAICDYNFVRAEIKKHWRQRHHAGMRKVIRGFIESANYWQESILHWGQIAYAQGKLSA